MQTPQGEDLATFVSRYEATRAALQGRCPKCERGLHEKLAYLSLHSSEFEGHAGPGHVHKMLIPWCPACEREPAEAGCLHTPMYSGQPSLAADIRCDFCMSKGVLLTADVRADVQIEGELGAGFTLVDEGTWGACAECAALIEAANWDGLLERGIVGTLAMHPEIPDRPDVRDELKARIRVLLQAVFGAGFK